MHAVMTIVGRTIHPCWIKVVFSMSYFSNFLVVAFLSFFLSFFKGGDMPLQHANSKNYTSRFWWGVSGGWAMGVVLIKHSLSLGGSLCKGVAMIIKLCLMFYH